MVLKYKSGLLEAMNTRDGIIIRSMANHQSLGGEATLLLLLLLGRLSPAFNALGAYEQTH